MSPRLTLFLGLRYDVVGAWHEKDGTLDNFIPEDGGYHVVPSVEVAAKLPPALKRRGVEAWLLEVVRPYGRTADNFARVVPRFGMALPWALHALEQARRHSLSAWIRGAP